MEISTAAREGLPVKFFVLDDQAYHYMQELQQPAYLRTTATILARLDYRALAQGWGVAYQEILGNDDLEAKLRGIWEHPGPVLVRVVTDYRGRPIRWIDAARDRYINELTPDQKVRFLARIGSRAAAALSPRTTSTSLRLSATSVASRGICAKPQAKRVRFLIDPRPSDLQQFTTSLPSHSLEIIMHRAGVLVVAPSLLRPCCTPTARRTTSPTRSAASRRRASRSPTPTAPSCSRAATRSARRSTALAADLKGKPALLELLPDVQIYHNAVRYALHVQRVLQRRRRSPSPGSCSSRAWSAPSSSRDGKAPWTTATGLVVRGYVSKIDGSVQPYGLVVPASYQPGAPHAAPARRLVPRPRRDAERAELPRRPAEVAGRVHAAARLRAAPLRPLLQRQQVRRRDRHASRRSTTSRKHYPIDDEPHRRARLLDGRGGVLAVRRPLRRTAGPPPRPGAGFSETPDFLKVFQNETLQADLVREEALALVRLHRLRRQPVQLPDGRLQRRDRQAEAGRRHDGRGAEAGGHRRWSTSSARRPATRTTRRRRRRSTAASTRIAAQGPRPAAAAGPLHDLDAALQPHATG